MAIVCCEMSYCNKGLTIIRYIIAERCSAQHSIHVIRHNKFVNRALNLKQQPNAKYWPHEYSNLKQCIGLQTLNCIYCTQVIINCAQCYNAFRVYQIDFRISGMPIRWASDLSIALTRSWKSSGNSKMDGNCGPTTIILSSLLWLVSSNGSLPTICYKRRHWLISNNIKYHVTD